MKISCPHCHYEYESDKLSNAGYIQCSRCKRPFLVIKTKSTRPCPMCGEAIKISARKCRFCGEYFDEAGYPIPKNKRLIYTLLALFFGGLGIHNFYAGENQIGFMHIVMTVMTLLSMFFMFSIIGTIMFIILLLLHLTWLIIEMITGYGITQTN